MKRVAALLMLLPSLSMAQFGGFPPISSTQFRVAGVLQTPTNYVDFSTGLSGSLSGGVLTITTTGGTPVPTSRTLTLSSPLACDSTAGATCDLSANRTLSLDQTLTYGWTGAHTWTTTAIGTANTANQTQTNTTAAALGAQQYSPMHVWTGQGWETTGGTSKANSWAARVRPVQGTASTAELDFLFNQNGAGSYTLGFSMSDDGSAVDYLTSGRSQMRLRSSTGDFFAVANGVFYVAPAGSIAYNITATAMYPQGNATQDLGIDAQGWRRARFGGTTPVAGDFVMSAGWGTTASVGTILGNDPHVRFTATSAGTGQAANPTITYTFKNGTWTTAPHCIVALEAITGSWTGGITVTSTTTATTLVITAVGTPVANDTAIFQTLCFGT